MSSSQVPFIPGLDLDNRAIGSGGKDVRAILFGDFIQKPRTFKSAPVALFVARAGNELYIVAGGSGQEVSFYPLID